MIGKFVTDTKTGEPLDVGGNKLTESTYQPPEEVKKLYAQCQTDYQRCWRLQHRTFQEFDGVSLLERTRLDQETFGAFVGAEFIPKHKQWKWRGRKNTARNKIFGIAAHMIAGMLFPYVHASNEENKEDVLTAKVMKILVENHLKKAGYEIKFLFMVISALANPAVFVEISYVEAMQRIKQRLSNGQIKIIEAVDELLSGINLDIYPVDQILLGDFYTYDIQKQPVLVKVRRINWDVARKVYSGKYCDENGKDLFDYVEAGKTRIILAGQEYQTLYDIDWTEGDETAVQELTFYYRHDDLEVTYVGGVFMGNEKDIYNNNPFKHRRMTLIEKDWISIPIIPIAKSGFEVLDPSMRFAYYKSAAFKEFWDDAAQNRMHQLAFDGTSLDVMKPMFLSGVANVDTTVMIPGAAIGMPHGAQATPYQLGPNLVAALNMMQKQEADMSESTQDKIMAGITQKGVTAYATAKAEQNARINLGNFGLFIADFVKQIGEFTIDCIINHTTIGEVDATTPEALSMKYKNILAKTKESGKDLTNRIIFTSRFMGREMSQDEIIKRSFKLYKDAGGEKTDQRIYEVNPYRFARNKFSTTVDAERIISRSMGTDELRNERAFAILTHPAVAPFTDQEAVANKFAIEKYADGDPDQFKRKGGQEDMLNQILSGQMQAQKPGGVVAPPVPQPTI